MKKEDLSVKTSVKIAQITDLHIDDFMSQAENINAMNNFNIILKDIIEKEIELVVLTGDYGNYNRFKTITDELINNNISYDYILGNHDKYINFKERNDIKHSRKKEGLFFSRRINKDLYLFLDSSNSAIEGFQLEWFNILITKEDYQRLFLFVHHPILNCGSTTMDRLFSLKNRDILKSNLVSIDKEVYIFSGHYHADHFIQEKNIKQFVTYSGLLQLEKNTDQIQINSKDFGYRIIDIGEVVMTDSILINENKNEV